MQADDDQELDTEQLLEQGDELLRSSRRLLEDLEEVIDITDDVEADETPDVDLDQTGSRVDSR